MSALTATSKIKIRETVLGKRTVQGVFSRQTFRNKIGLPTRKALVRTRYTDWSNIIYNVEKTNEDLAANITKTLLDKDISLNEGILIRDGFIGAKNVWELLKRQELRETLDLPPLEKPCTEQILGKVLDQALSTRGIETYEALVANYFVSWYGILENPDNIEALRESPFLEVPQDFLMACYKRVFTLAIALKVPSITETQNPLQGSISTRAGEYRKYAKKLTSPFIKQLLRRANIRTALGFAPLPFNEGLPLSWQRRMVSQAWNYPLTLGEIVAVAGIDPAQYSEEIMGKKVWIRERYSWREHEKERPEIAKQVLKRASLRALLNSPALDLGTTTIALKEIIETLPANNQMRKKIKELEEAGFYDNPRSATQTLIQQVDRSKKSAYKFMGYYLAAYVIVAHFRQEGYSFDAAARDVLNILQDVAPNDLYLQGKIISWMAHLVFSEKNQVYNYTWPLFYMGEEKAEIVLVSTFSLLMETDKLTNFLSGCLADYSGYFHSGKVQSCLEIFAKQKGIRLNSLPEELLELGRDRW